MVRMTAFLGLILMLAACQVFGGSDSGGSSGGGDAPPVDEASVIQWDRNPNTIIFRAEVVGGETQDAFFMLNDVPYCTIYGDNRVVWTASSGATDSPVLWDRLTDVDIRAFVSSLAVAERFYTYEPGADKQAPSAVSPVIEQLTLFVNGVEQRSDAFSGWPQDYFQRVLDSCRRLSKAPVEYEPEAGWISARLVDYDTRVPSLIWDGTAAGLSLKELADSGSPRWVTDNNVKLLWRMLRNSALDAHFIDGEDSFQIAIQVPGITRNAPPPPSS